MSSFPQTNALTRRASFTVEQAPRPQTTRRGSLDATGERAVTVKSLEKLGKATLDKLENDLPQPYICVIEHTVLKVPVYEIQNPKQKYEDAAIKEWLKAHAVSPFETNRPMRTDDLVADFALKDLVDNDPVAQLVARKEAELAARGVDIAPVDLSPVGLTALMRYVAPAETMHYQHAWEGFDVEARQQRPQRTRLQRAARAAGRPFRACADEPALNCLRGTAVFLAVILAATPTWVGAMAGGMLMTNDKTSAEKQKHMLTAVGAGFAVNVAIAAAIYACCCRSRRR